MTSEVRLTPSTRANSVPAIDEQHVIAAGPVRARRRDQRLFRLPVLP